MYRIEPVRKNYAWGSTQRLQSLFHLDEPGPLAELWFSGHPESPSVLDVDGDRINLAEAIDRAPEFMLGHEVVQRWGDSLPFLFKIISAQVPLSLQVHPSLDRAREGFARESESGLDLSDPCRTFKDPVAKHEMVVALEDFSASVGFLPLRKQIAALSMVEHPLAHRMVEVLAGADKGKTGARNAVDQAFRIALGWEEDGTCREGDPSVSQAIIRASFGCDPGSPLAHAARAAEAFPADRSALAIVMMNPVELQQGGSVFIPTGIVHAYLSGTGAEIMTNSDNVLRAGLTGKYKDLPRFLENMDCRPAPPLDPSSGLIKMILQADVVTYRPTLQEFMLAYGHVDPRCQEPDHWWAVSDRLRQAQARFAQAVGPQHVLASQGGPRVIVCLEGIVRCRTNSHVLDLKQGEAAFIPASEKSVTVSGGSPAPGSYILASCAL